MWFRWHRFLGERWTHFCPMDYVMCGFSWATTVCWSTASIFEFYVFNSLTADFIMIHWSAIIHFRVFAFHSLLNNECLNSRTGFLNYTIGAPTANKSDRNAKRYNKTKIEQRLVGANKKQSSVARKMTAYARDETQATQQQLSFMNAPNVYIHPTRLTGSTSHLFLKMCFMEWCVGNAINEEEKQHFKC